jgi:hypothetical protein
MHVKIDQSPRQQRLGLRDTPRLRNRHEVFVTLSVISELTTRFIEELPFGLVVEPPAIQRE